MNLYLVEQTVNNDYDTYDSMVVAAMTEEEARNTHPSGYTWKDDSWVTRRSITLKDTTWCLPTAVSVTMIGKALDDHFKNQEVVLSSFNAG